MKKSFAVAAAVLALCISLSACGSDPEPIEPEQTQPTVPVSVPITTPMLDVPNNAQMLLSTAEPVTEFSAVKREHYDNGSYYYMDETADQKIRCISSSYQTTIREGETEEDYATRRAIGLSVTLSPGTPYNMNVVHNQELSDALGYPVYLAAYSTGGDLDAVNWTVFMTRTEYYSYQYAFAVSAWDDTVTEDSVMNYFCTLKLTDLPS